MDPTTRFLCSRETPVNYVVVVHSGDASGESSFAPNAGEPLCLNKAAWRPIVERIVLTSQRLQVRNRTAELRGLRLDPFVIYDCIGHARNRPAFRPQTVLQQSVAVVYIREIKTNCKVVDEVFRSKTAARDFGEFGEFSQPVLYIYRVHYFSRTESSTKSRNPRKSPNQSLFICP